MTTAYSYTPERVLLSHAPDPPVMALLSVTIALLHSIRTCRLPSTSPANASPRDRKLAEWAVLA